VNGRKRVVNVGFVRVDRLGTLVATELIDAVLDEVVQISC